MKTRAAWTAALACLMISAPAARAGQVLQSQAFAGSMPAPGDGGGALGATPDNSAFADGTRAINEGRWLNAVAIFGRIAAEKGDHAEGALYWKAYAENKLGRTADSLETCSGLRGDYPKSTWIDECGALEIEIHAKAGKPVQPTPEQSDDVKLLALNSLIQHDDAKARAEIEDILNDEDSSDHLKTGALFVLGQHHSDVSYPEIVRVSYAEGDVRIARGRQNEKNGAAWEKVEANTPIELGFSLVTGAGRAEIELENASTIYLDENSVLTFNDLHATDNVPYSEIALLSGTVTLHVRPFIAGEVFLIKTPTDDDFLTAYPHATYMRVTSYLDATAITPLAGGVIRLAGGPQTATVGQTMFYRTQHRLDSSAVNVAQSYADWDKWVADRVDTRAKATAETMQAAGLTVPLPGMAEMQGQGKFFDCAPYGTCWEPKAAEEWEQQNGEEGGSHPATEAVRNSSAAAASEQVVASGDAASKAPRVVSSQPNNTPAGSGSTGPGRLGQYDFFPCLPGDGLYRNSTFGVDPYAYRWTVCHSGYWIQHHGHYAWVVGKRHHHPPARWCKSGKTVVYVPIHPKDVKGQMPINVKNRVFAVGKGGNVFEPVRFNPDRPIALMKDAPREFRATPMPTLARAEEPHAIGHSVRDLAAGAGRPEMAKGTPITFDHKSGSFNVAHQEMHGGHTVTVSAPISNHGGNLQSHGGFGGSSGGGTRAGGGSSGGSGGGGSHGGSGGGSSGATSSSGSSSSGGSSGGGGGGSHH